MHVMNAPLYGLSLYAIALATLLSAFIRFVQSTQLRRRVEWQMTGPRELAELSGITDPRDLQDAFGPPGMDRVWRHITLPQIEEKRLFAGHLMSDPRVQAMSAAFAILSLILQNWVTQIFLIAAAIAQAGAWLAATRLPK